MSFVENDAGPLNSMQPIGVPGEYPAWIILCSFRHAEYLDLGRGVDHLDFAPPIELERGGTDHEDHPRWRCDLHADDGLAGFAEPHIVAENCPTFRDKECNSIGLMGIE